MSAVLLDGSPTSKTLNANARPREELPQSPSDVVGTSYNSRDQNMSLFSFPVPTSIVRLEPFVFERGERNARNYSTVDCIQE